MKVYDAYLDVLPTRAGRWMQSRRIRQEWKLISRHKPRIETVVEIGPGHGLLGQFVHANDLIYIGVEANFRIAQALAKQTLAICQSFTPPLPLKSNVADVVFASHVLEHMSDGNTAFTFLQECKRVAKPGGVVFMIAPDLLACGLDFWDGDYTHTFPVTEQRLRSMAADADLEFIEIVYFAGPVEGPLSTLISLAARVLPARLYFYSPILKLRLGRLRASLMRNVGLIARKKIVTDKS